MALVETEALVLRTYNLAEADKIVVCLCRATGLIRGVAKGCRRLKNRFGAAFEPFTLINLTYYHKENQELVSIGQAEIVRSSFDVLSEPVTLAGLAYMGDLETVFVGADPAFRCQSCGATGTHALSKKVHALLRAALKLAPGPFGQQSRETSDKTTRELAQLTQQMIGRVLEREMRTRPSYVPLGFDPKPEDARH